MNNFEKMIESYTIKYDKKIKEVCQPLTELLAIDIFTYFNINSEGNIVTLSNFPEQLLNYYGEGMHRDNPYLVSPKLLSSGYVLTATTPLEEYVETLEWSRRRYNMQHSFLQINRVGESVEGFLFAMKKNDASAPAHYLNHAKRLAAFGRYFLRGTDSILKAMEEEGFNLAQEKGESFFIRDPHLPLSAEDASLKAFTKAISPLSPRERECLDMFCQGYSAQQTAAKMGLSRRTIEHYFENMKNKLNVTSKWDLLNL